MNDQPNESDKFLKDVAGYFARHPELQASTTLVFPNKRAAIFFRLYLKKMLKSVSIIPETVTIGAFEARYCDEGNNSNDHIELLMVLYKAYQTVVERHREIPMSFDRFAFWGDIILSDFNQIDRSLVDAESLYINLERYNEISSNFLTTEQLEVIREIWGDERISMMGRTEDTEKFWLHIDHAGADESEAGNGARRYLKLWQITGEIYREYQRLLDKEGLAYPGLIERRVSDYICENAGSTEHGRVAFIGFNSISVAQARMMKALKRHDNALFFWDLLPDSDEAPYARSAGRMIRRLSKVFPMPDDFVSELTYKPRITILSVPGNFLQSKVAGMVLNAWCRKNQIKSRIPDNTAIVMPDQALLPAMLHSLPESLNNIDANDNDNRQQRHKINITMGLSYRQTPFATLLRSIIGMHLRRRFISGKLYFFRDDVLQVTGNHNLQAIDPEGCRNIEEYITRFPLYNYDADELKKQAGSQTLVNMFSDIDACDIDSVKHYLSAVIGSLADAMHNTTNGKLNTEAHEIKVLEAYAEAIDRVFDNLKRHNITDIGEGTLLSMLDKLMGAGTLNMSGSPVTGMQIMGVLESRALDFDNVIVMSLNERIFPRRNHTRSMIPQQLRRAYGLPTNDEEELEFAYYFFRLLSRSKHVVFTYDSRTTGLSSGAMSRYLMQLKYMPGMHNPHFINVRTRTQSGKSREIHIEKDTANVRELLQLFKCGKTDDARNISASALKKYLNCPLQFYLDYVLGVRSEDEPTGYMDSKTYGTIVHNVLEDLFIETRKDPKDENPVQITETILRRMIADKNALLQRVYRKIDDKYHHKRYLGRLDRMPSESLLLGEVMRDFIVRVIEKETDWVKQNGPFEFVGSEMSLNTKTDGKMWKASDTNTINVRLDIDRVDRLSDGTYKFIDYKTGGDVNRIYSIPDLFSPIPARRNDAAFQLLFYSMLYADLRDVHCSIKPSLYRLRVAFGNKSNEKKFDDDGLYLDENNEEALVWSNIPGKEPVWANEFRTYVSEIIDKIFDDDTPFYQTAVTDACKYCHFTDVCRRIPPEDRT